MLTIGDVICSERTAVDDSGALKAPVATACQTLASIDSRWDFSACLANFRRSLFPTSKPLTNFHCSSGLSLSSKALTQ
ncbi:hypothetical protein A6X21_22850 [Planctopirus hydrillae]|uniref:Uncharacterized protein n=1 Tax=Planctopirus hydrillae TaxID=1841610 RepID=A0A1C3ECQ7_9PLAN|nr:hypothetical protein A6X21_22850 [Planctopirus hydrillae]